MEIELPYPPSVNHYWRMWRGRMVTSGEGRAYQRTVEVLLRARGVKPIPGKLAVTIEVCPPDLRRRDLDNLLKCLGDSLQRGGAFLDDSQIIWLLIEKATVVPGGKVMVRITERCMAQPPQNNEQSELIGAAMRYCAVADWFESRPGNWQKRLSMDAAMEIFNRAEAELRDAGMKALRQHGHRKLVLQAAGVPGEGQ